MSSTLHGQKKNKGEWAEFYTMLRLLGEGKLYAASPLLEKKREEYLNVLGVIREESGVVEYLVNTEDKTVSVVEKDSKQILNVAPTSDYSRMAGLLFDDLQNRSGRSIEVSNEVCDFADEIHVSKPKAPSVKTLSSISGGKSDIIVRVHDPKTSIESVMGFSIKSKFASNSTLFNAGTSSQFLFELPECDALIMNEFNSISDGDKRGWTECKQYLKKKEISFRYSRTVNPIYTNNMVLIRDSMPEIMAWCVKDRLIDSDRNYEVKETIERMIKANPLGVSNPDVFYEKVIKDFLIAGFTGMTAARVWDGREQVNGGYIVVMENGEVLCYHASDREAFRDYLFMNTHFEYVSTSKYRWGYIEHMQNGYYLPLNVSVRFNKHTR